MSIGDEDMSDNDVAVVVGGADVFNTPAGQQQVRTANNRGDYRVAQALPPLTELVRMGNTWTMRTATASAFNAVAALPTTLAAAILYNGEVAGGKSYVIHSLFCTTIVTAAAATQYSLICQVLPNPSGVATAPTHSATTTLLNSRSGKASYTGLAKRAIGVTTFFTDMWEVVGTNGGLAAANVGGGVFADVQGGIIIPPGGALGLNVVAGTVNTAGMIVGCTWTEIQLTTG
jgi:hypothetical protein